MNLYQFFFFISLLGVFQGALVGGQFFLRNHQASRLSYLMGGLFLSGALGMLSITLANAQVIVNQSWLFFIEYSIGLTAGPLMWFTIKTLKKQALKYPLFHFSPSILFIILQISSPHTEQWPILIVMLHLQAYTLVSFFEYIGIPKNRLSASYRKFYKWAGWLLAFYIFMGLSQWIRYIFADYPQLNLIVPMTASLHLYIVVMVGFNRSISRKGVERHRKRAITFPRPFTDQKHQILHKIANEQYYLKEGLNISEVAVKLSLPAHELSTLLNEVIPGGFVVYINHLRVEHAKKLLADPQWTHLSMEGIGKESGFQSRSAFYHYFKQECQMTPLAFQKKMSGISK